MLFSGRNLLRCCLTLVFVVAVQSAALAIDVTKILQDPLEEQKLEENKPIVALLFVNNAKATYDDELNKKVMGNFDTLLGDKYRVVPGQRYIELLNKNGIVDITTAERSDIIQVFTGENVDYVLYCELQPFIRKQRVTFFTVGMDMTAVMPLKILDLKAEKYLYNGKFTEIASDSTMIGSIGNKSVSLKALDKVLEKMNDVIAVRLPAARPGTK